MKHVFLIGLFGLSAVCSFGQNRSLTIQTDLMDPIAKGVSLWLNLDAGSHRLFLASGFNELPDFLNPDQTYFKEKRDFFQQLGYVHRIGKKGAWMVGAQLIYQDMTITEKATNNTQDLAALRACPIVFYEVKPFKKVAPVTLAPWMSYRFDVLRKDAVFASRAYQTQFANFAMGLNLGYKFRSKS